MFMLKLVHQGNFFDAPSYVLLCNPIFGYSIDLPLTAKGCLHMNALRVLTCLACMASSAVFAQDKDDEQKIYTEMEVVAEKRTEKEQDVPLSMKVLPQSFLEDGGVETLTEAQAYVPNLFLSEFSARRTSYPFIRGIGSGLGDPAVTVYVDGVPRLTPFSNKIDMTGLARVEVLRGPQGSLYGRNTMGGLINYVSQEPGNDFKLDLDTTFGSEAYTRHRLNLSGAISEDRAFYGISVAKTDRDGFTTNDLTGNDLDHQDTTFAKAQFVFKPTEQWHLRLGAHHERNRDGGFVLYDLGSIEATPHRILNDFEGETERDITAPNLTAVYTGDSYQVTLISAFETLESIDTSDVDFSPLDFIRRETREDNDQWYYETRVQSLNDIEIGNARMNWLVGLSYYTSEFEHGSVNTFRPDFVQQFVGFPIELQDVAAYSLDDSGYGLFGQVGFRFDNGFEVDLGARYLDETREAVGSVSSGLVPEPLNQNAFNIDKDFDDVLPRINLAYHHDNGWMAFASAAKGYRSGGYNRNTGTTGGYEFEEETSWTYEAGFKTAFGDRWLFDATYFVTSWDDRQLEVPDPFLPGRFYLDNVGEAESRGFELELRGLISEGIAGFAGFGLADAQFTQYIDPFSGQDVDDNQLPNSPENTWNLGVDVNRAVSGDWIFTARAEVVGVGEIYFDNLNTQSESGYELVNLRAGFEYRSVRVELWGRNITDETYVPLALPGSFSPSGWAGRLGAPAVYGVTAGYRF
jgi:iron complex outermembrane receptor protein